MEQIIERLKSQKREAEGNFRAVGLDWGTEWAMGADYSELKYAVEEFDPYVKPILYGRDEEEEYKERMRRSGASNISRNKIIGDKILGKYFEKSLLTSSKKEI